MVQVRRVPHPTQERIAAQKPCPSLPVWLGLFASLLTMVGGIWDISWHRTSGRDSFWSPPHLFAIGAAAVIRVGLIVALVHERHPAAKGAVPWQPELSWRRTTVADWVLLLLLSLLLGNLTFALGECDYLDTSRAPFLYPILASLAAPVALVAGIRTVGRVGTATLIALLLTLQREIATPLLLAAGFVPPSPAPLYLVPAIIMDLWFWLVRRTDESAWKSVAAGILFAWIFIGTEYGYTAYLTGIVWSMRPLALSEPLACIAGAVSALAGHHFARWLLRPHPSVTPLPGTENGKRRPR